MDYESQSFDDGRPPVEEGWRPPRRPQYKARVKPKERTIPCFARCGSPERQGEQEEEEDGRRNSELPEYDENEMPPAHDEDTSWHTRIWARASSKVAVTTEVALLNYGLQRKYELVRVPIETTRYGRQYVNTLIVHPPDSPADQPESQRVSKSASQVSTQPETPEASEASKEITTEASEGIREASEGIPEAYQGIPEQRGQTGTAASEDVTEATQDIPESSVGVFDEEALKHRPRRSSEAREPRRSSEFSESIPEFWGHFPPKDTEEAQTDRISPLVMTGGYGSGLAMFYRNV
eukprot:1195635-Pyramimonas_sp.AAC.1